MTVTIFDFRNRNCVSFFDYRSASSEQIDEAIGKCSPYDLSSADPELVFKPKIAFLFLSDTAHHDLVLWTKWKEEQAYTEKIVPWFFASSSTDAISRPRRFSLIAHSNNVNAVLNSSLRVARPVSRAKITCMCRSIPTERPTRCTIKPGLPNTNCTNQEAR